MARRQLPLLFGPIRNRNLLSNHWLDERLRLEPEWADLRSTAEDLIGQLGLLWRQQRERVPQYAEANLEQAFIQPILTRLGWTFLYQTSLRGRKPDYALFLQGSDLDAALGAGRTNIEFWERAVLVGDAKTWAANLDRPIRTENQREYPPEQIEWYIHHSGTRYGLLTNGRLWRLYPRNLSAHQRRFETYLECDLGDLLGRWVEAGGDARQRTWAEDEPLIDDFLKFYLFFSPVGFTATAERKPLIERAVEGSNVYRVGIGEGLKNRVFHALQTSIQGFLSCSRNNLNPDRDLSLCRDQSLVLLYRILFVMYAEDRDLLPFRTNRAYREIRSLSRLRDQIAGRFDLVEEGREQDYRLDSFALWEDLALLFRLVDTGGRRFDVPAYNGGLFDDEEHAFLREKVLSDWHLARVIDQLSRAPDEQHPDSGLWRVDYQDLSIQHLGHVYEGLLELQPQRAREQMIVVRKRRGHEQKIIAASEAIPPGFERTNETCPPGEVFLATDKGERRASGSYYTPNHVVDYIVQKTLGPLCAQIATELQAEIDTTEGQLRRARGQNRELLKEKLAALRSDFDDRVLRLKILDPAMGSGHFLLRACQYLAEEIATNPNADDPAPGHFESDESTLSFWKRRVVEHCLYGVDMNPLAVELAKVALWLETAAINYPLTFLDHHLRWGNSLVGARVADLGSLPGNEPLPLFEQQLALRMPRVLDGLAQIADRPSDTVEGVKEKARTLKSVVDAIRGPFIAIADLWCATYFLERADQITPDQYARALDTIGSNNHHTRLRREDWFLKALNVAHRSDVSCFHWELEFPEVFFDLTGRREDGGFDVVLSNPPWGHAQSLEILKGMPLYEPVNDDHAECFICLTTTLTRPGGGRIGLVLPDTILSPAKKGIRRLMLQQTMTDAIMNIGPDWFTTAIRMSTVLWSATHPLNDLGGYQFRSCVLPINVRRAAQTTSVSLYDAIHESERSVDAGECLLDADVAIPLFGDEHAVALMKRVTDGAPTLEELCDHGRGVELNKAGFVIRCPNCGLWDAPPLKDEQGRFREKRCTHCQNNYLLGEDYVGRTLVHSDPQDAVSWRPYIDGDSIARYISPAVHWIDTSADGVNYKPEMLYASPKVLIRQAGIGVNAILDANLNAYCPQSVYVYRVKADWHEEGFDEHLLAAILCSRLFHLQVFMSFGEIDSSRAFSKLTHTRLSRMRTVPPRVIAEHPVVVSHIRDCVSAICATQERAAIQQNDWAIEGCWSYLLGITAPDVRCIIHNFSKVHHNETMESLFPGGLEGNRDRWIAAWSEAIELAGQMDST